MNLNEATLQLLLLVLPGFVWSRFARSIRTTEKVAVAEELISALIYGVITYLALYLVYMLFGQHFSLVDFGTINWRFQNTLDEVLLALPTACILAIFMVKLQTSQFLLNWFRSKGVTNFSGDLDIWDYCFSRSHENSQYVNVRDLENDLIIQGYVTGYSERADLRELLLSNAEVYDAKGELLVENDSIYLARAPASITLEFYPNGVERDDGTEQAKSTPTE